MAIGREGDARPAAGAAGAGLAHSLLTLVGDRVASVAAALVDCAKAAALAARANRAAKRRGSWVCMTESFDVGWGLAELACRGLVVGLAPCVGVSLRTARRFKLKFSCSASENRLMTEGLPRIHWTDDGQTHSAVWRSLSGHAPPGHVQLVGDDLSAGTALRLARAGTGLLWCGDYQNARHLLQAMGRRLEQQPATLSLGNDKPLSKCGFATLLNPHGGRPASAGLGAPTRDKLVSEKQPATLRQVFAATRQAQAQRALLLGQLLLPFDADHGLPLRRAPDVRAAGLQAHGAAAEHYVASLRELLGLIGAFEWRKKGVPIDALQGRIHPHHGVFSPVRGEYVDLVAQAPLPAVASSAGAFDIGCGTGVLAAVLAQRGVQVVATDIDARALACTRDNLQRLGLASSVTVQAADLFPPGRAGVVLCNPPWLPAQPHSALDAAVYDPDSRMLRGFLAGLREHLADAGEGWLVMSDLAEHLGLRTRAELLGWIAHGGLRVLGRLDTRPRHARAGDASDPLHAARAAEVTSLWRLQAAPTRRWVE